MTTRSATMTRFLAPRHAFSDVDIDQWHVDADATTPGADARCRLFLRLDTQARLVAVFSAYGPPVVIAAADWLCEAVTGKRHEDARALTPRTIEQALVLPAGERYAALLVIDALAKALSNLGR